MTSTKDFFIRDNSVAASPDLDYSRVDEYIKSAEAFSRLTCHSVYIIDYYKKSFLYVSNNPMFLCGLAPQEVKELGYRFYLEHVPDDELQLLVDINTAGFAFFSRVPLEDRAEWYIVYDFHVVNNGHKILVNHKLTPLALTPDGQVWLALCVVSASTHSSAGHIEIHREGSSDYFTFNCVTRRWDRHGMCSLKEREKEVITLSIRGYTMAEIADKMSVSNDTVKKYRQRIFEKLEVRNISEAISAAINNRLI